jgi:aminoglycoside phosphotransferase (APT) family kinase protein
VPACREAQNDGVQTESVETPDGRALRKIAEGREAEMFEWEDGTILRLARNEGAHADVQWQVWLLSVADAAGLRVPKVYEQLEIQGRPGIVMERIQGPDLLSLVERRPFMVWRAGRLTGRLHAEMHRASIGTDLPSTKDRVRRMTALREHVSEEIAQWASSELERLPDGDALCHGDFHPANILLAGDEPVIIDWSNATQGDPHADVARTLLIFRIGEPPQRSGIAIRALARFGRRLLLSAYLRGYRAGGSLDAALVERWVPVRAADRLADGITEERPALLRIIRRAMDGR